MFGFGYRLPSLGASIHGESAGEGEGFCFSLAVGTAMKSGIGGRRGRWINRRMLQLPAARLSAFQSENRENGGALIPGMLGGDDDISSSISSGQP